MYPILKVIYGVPVSEEIQELIENFLDKNDLREDDYGYHTLYHGSLDERPAYVGIKLKTIDLIEPSYLISDFLKVKISDKNKQLAEEYINKFPEEIKNKFGKVDIYIMNSSS